jgi:putative transposase
LRLVLNRVRQERPFRIDALAVLPEHLHAVWTLPPNDYDYAGRWRLIKSRFTHALAKADVRLSRNAKGEYDVWQRRFWEHTIRDEVDLRRHVDYVHFNPVRHGWVQQVKEWPYSTFHRFVLQGIYPIDWAGDAEGDGVYGECVPGFR